MLLEIFNAPLASGAQVFLTIVCVLIGLVAGLSIIDVKTTLFKNKEEKH